MIINKISDKPGFYKNTNICFVLKKDIETLTYINNEDKEYVKNQADSNSIIPIYNKTGHSYLVIIENNQNNEDFRVQGNKLFAFLKTEQPNNIFIDGSNIHQLELLAFAEGIVLSGYKFNKYISENKNYSIDNINLYHDKVDVNQAKHLNHLLKAVFWARDMVNEPYNSLNAEKFAKEVSKLGEESGFNVEIFDKRKIESLKMGGLLSVNKGSIDPPTFTVCEWKPKNAKNSKPYILVGKGVMYDTGGLSLKPTAGSMDSMKSDMAGAAAVASTLYAMALCKKPVWIIGLIPATDNRPDGNAYAPGDIIQMYNKLYVEVLNTDAEGRLILADALSYADKYNPELVIDLATLTGSAAMAIGKHASICMGNADAEKFNTLINAGDKAHERLVQFPFWDDYKKSLKSNIADLKNIGEREGGAISAGKFLEHFTKSPYIHIDIAGTAFLDSDDSYRLKGATGVGVRMLTEFFKTISSR
jgi:leucyl aminopeptidase